jgi:hypothetical protein
MALRVLIAIPHHIGSHADYARHGSQTQQPERRAAALRNCLAGIHESFGGGQCVFDLARPRAARANGATTCELHVVLCTTRGLHVLDHSGLGKSYFEHVELDVEPMMLGFECHRVLRERLDGYDYYGYLEDDLILHDGWLLAKLDAFREAVGSDKLLLPNRYERTRDFPLLKAYIDGPLHDRFVVSLRQPSGSPQEVLQFFDKPVVVRRPPNPHSGCFFLHQTQMAKWAATRHFLDRDVSFVSPLESAATLGVARTFAIYKPAPRVANFLEIEHFGRRWIEKLVRRAVPREAEHAAKD